MGNEPMFPALKPRGFDVERPRTQHPDRLARLLLVMALALCSHPSGPRRKNS